MAKMGRPTKPRKDKKLKMHISVDADVYDFIQKQDNRSDWVNRAARSRMNAQKRVERVK